MRPLNYILRKCTGGYKLNKSPEKINDLIYMDDIRVFVKNGKELETSNITNKNIQSAYRN